jgi:hypothetical protein
MLICVLLAVVATTGLFPETETGTFLRRLLIEEPAERLNTFSPRRAFFSVACFIALIAIAPIMIEAAIPVEMALLMAGDMVVYLEAASMVSLLAAQGRLQGVARAIRSFIGRLARPRVRRSRSAAARRPGQKGAEDEGAGLAFA